MSEPAKARCRQISTPFRNRSASCVDLDDMLGVILKGLEDLGVLNTTYFFFSADNGYHLGEHHLLFGKTEPYETDIRLPMYVRGPGVPAGEKRAHPTTHLDIVATIVQLAGAEQYLSKGASYTLDGKDFSAALTSAPPAVQDWRAFSFSEFYSGENTYWAVRVIGNSSEQAPSNNVGGDEGPTSGLESAGLGAGEALYTFHFWCTNQSEVFSKANDPYQMVNLAPGRLGRGGTAFGQEVVHHWLPLTVNLGKCSGRACSDPSRALPTEYNASAPLPCHDAGPKLEVDELYLDP